MKRSRFFTALALIFVLSASAFCLSASAKSDTVKQDDLEVTITTDKNDYSGSDVIKETLKIKNNNKGAVENVSCVANIPAGYSLADGYDNRSSFSSIESGKTVSYDVAFVRNGGGSGSSGVVNTPQPGNGGTASAKKKGPNILPWIIIGIILLLLLIGLLVFFLIRRKKRKSYYDDFYGGSGGSGIISIILCIGIIGMTACCTGIPAKAAEQKSSTVTVSTQVKHDGSDVRLSADVSYSFMYYTVAFNTDGGSSVNPQSVRSGDKAKKPSDPKKAGNKFSGWYSDAALTSKFDFNSPVTADTEVYAKWENGDQSGVVSGGSGTETGSGGNSGNDTSGSGSGSSGSVNVPGGSSGTVPAKKTGPNILPWIIIAGIILLLLGIGLAIFFILRNKKRKSYYGYDDFYGGGGSGGVI